MGMISTSSDGNSNQPVKILTAIIEEIIFDCFSHPIMVSIIPIMMGKYSKQSNTLMEQLLHVSIIYFVAIANS